MHLLAIETSTMTGSVAIVGDNNLVGEYTLNIRETHSARLLPAIDRLLKDAHLTIQAIDGFAVSLGPGSFTGLRIGVSTAKGLAQALRKPLIGIPTLDGLAHNLFSALYPICPLLDAHKGEVYAAIYQSKNGELKRLTEFLAIAPSRLIGYLDEICGKSSPVIFLGEGLSKYGKMLGEVLGKRAVFAPKALQLPRAASIAELGLKELKEGRSMDLFSLQPLYLRRANAEIKWEERERTKF